MKSFFTKTVILTCIVALVVGTVTYLRQIEPTEPVKSASTTSSLSINEAVSTTAVSPVPTRPKQTAILSKPLTQVIQPEPNILASVETENNEDDAKEAAEKRSVGERWAAEFEMIKDPKTGQLPRDAHQKGIMSAKKVQELHLPAEFSPDGVSSRSLPTIGVTVRGPNNYGGRTRAIAFDKRDPQIIVTGGVSSGVFRSINGGASWTRVTPAGEIHGVTAIAQDPRTGQEDTWYFATGEQNNSAGGTGASYLGNGLWKSTNNGVTWTALASTQGNLYAFDNDFDNNSRIVIDPNNGAILVGASETIKRSTDGGANWTNVLGNTNTTTGRPTDIIYNAASNAFYAAIHGADTEGGVYRSPDGVTWTKLRTPVQLEAGGVKRIVLSNVANTANILALYETTNPVCGTGATASNAGLQLYDATAMTWTDHSQKIGFCAGGTSDPKNISFQDGYNMCIATKPNDANIIYLGGVEIYRLNLATSDYQYIGGDQGTATPTNLHVDNHLLIFQPNSNDIMWAGNDGGLRRTDVTGTIAAGPTGGYTWTDRTSGYITYQYYRADINPTNGSDFLAGAAQDNAITLQPSTAEAKEIHGGDGTAIGIISGTDFNTYNVIVATQNGNVSRILNGTGMDIKPTGQAQGFKTYFLLDADNTNYLYYPTNTKKLFRTRNASNIANGTIGDVATNWEEMTGIATTLSGNISALAATRNVANAAYSASDANRRMYIGTDDGKVYRFADPAFTAVASTPTEITPAGSMGYVSDVAVNPLNDKELLVTYSNYNAPSVWYTADASVATPTWVNVEGAAGSAVELASARSAMIVNTGTSKCFVVGTSTGLYGTLTLNGATTVWERIGTSEIALSPSVSMRLRTSDNKMVLGTHGNGLFMLTFPTSALPLDLLTFEAIKNKAAVQLKWATANEVDFSHYNVQKSDDAKSFTLLTKVAATGGGSYQVMDEQPIVGQNYYRLEMVDRDGKKRYSKVVSALFGAKTSDIAVYPNPAKDNKVTLDMSIDTDKDLIIEWIDLAGRSRLRSNQKATQGNSQITVDITTLETGVYFISARNAVNNDLIKTLRFVKQ